MKFFVKILVLIALLATTNATLLRLLLRKLGYLNQRPLVTYAPVSTIASTGGTPSHQNSLQHPVSYSIIPTGVTAASEKGTLETGTIIPGKHKYSPIGSNYQLVPGSGAVLNINTQSKDGWAYALQPITEGEVNYEHDRDLEQYYNGIPATSYGVPFYPDSRNLPYETVQQNVNSNELDSTKFSSPIYVESPDFELPDDINNYVRSYTLEDGIQVTERGKLVTKDDGSVAFEKEGQYQYYRPDGKLVTIKWVADDGGITFVK